MTRPAAALSSGLLVRKGMARPLDIEGTERPTADVTLTFRPFNAPAQSNVHRLPPAVTPQQASRARWTAARLAGAWRALASRWGLPTILFVAGLSMVSVVAVTGPGPAAPPAVVDPKIASPASRPPGPTPVTWVDHGLMANPALAGR